MNLIKLMIATVFFVLLFSTNVLASSRMYVTADCLNLRSEPRICDNIIKTLEYNTYVTVEKIIGEWAKIRTAKGSTAYCYAEFLSKKPPKKQSPDTIFIGYYTITYYCNCPECCGEWSGGLTASGTIPTANRTVASTTLPFGTKVMIMGNVYTVEDTGGLDVNQIDVYLDDHEECIRRGLLVDIPVYIVN